MKRNAILYGVAGLCSALIYGFFALPAYTVPILGSTGNGYENLDLVLHNMAHAGMMEQYAAIAGLVLLILAGLTFVGCAVLMLCELKVIKNETFAAFATWATRYLTRALVSFAVLQLFFNIMAGYQVFTSKTEVSVPTDPGWAMIIITFILSIVPCAVTAYVQFKAKQEKKSGENK